MKISLVTLTILSLLIFSTNYNIDYNNSNTKSISFSDPTISGINCKFSLVKIKNEKKLKNETTYQYSDNQEFECFYSEEKNISGDYTKQAKNIFEKNKEAINSILLTNEFLVNRYFNPDKNTLNYYFYYSTMDSVAPLYATSTVYLNSF